MANRSMPSRAYGQAGKNQTNHSKRLQSSAPGRHDASTVLPKVRAVGKSDETGKAVTGTAATDLFSSGAHGYAVGDRVKFSGLTGGTGISTTTDYFLDPEGFAVGAFKVSTTPPNVLGNPQVASVVASTDVFTTTGHGLSVGQGVRVIHKDFSGLPTEGVTYYVISSGLTADAFKLSTTRGGATINVPTDGSVTWQTIGGVLLDFTTDLTAGTVTRSRTHQAGAHRVTTDQGETLPGIQGPRTVGRVD